MAVRATFSGAVNFSNCQSGGYRNVAVLNFAVFQLLNVVSVCPFDEMDVTRANRNPIKVVLISVIIRSRVITKITF